MSATGLVLFIDTTHPCLSEKISGLGYECIHKPGISREELLSLIPEITGLIVRSRCYLGKEELQHATRLRFIGRLGSGLENIDTAYAESRGIVCLNSPEGNRVSVGEHAVGMLLCLLNKICKANQEVKQGVWERDSNRGTELCGKVVGLIGFGNTGSAFAQCLSGFQVKVLAYDKYKRGFSGGHVAEASMDEIFEQADVLSLHVPLTSETRYLVNQDFLSRFSKEIIIMNTSRGAVLDTAALVAMLKQGRVQGAALDVLEYEALSFENLSFGDLPVHFQALASNPGVLLTPHVGGWTHESYRKLSEVLFNKIAHLSRG